ncbi:hypothetical protein BH10BAC4_BH10BAC4_11210 [soil metagenome]
MNWKFWEKKKVEKKNKSAVREWVDAVTFAVIAATLIRWLIMEAYTIPTPSMENSLLVGDFLFVSKFHYGTRTPKTILQVPLTHQKIWFTEIPSYVTWVQLPQYRLPGISHVKNGDVVVFNVPGISENNLNVEREKWIDYPVDLKTNYIKRCVGISGDVIQVKDRQVFINGTPLDNPPKMQFKYKVVSNDVISLRNLNILGLDEEDYHLDGRQDDNKPVYTMVLTNDKAAELKALSYISSVELEKQAEDTPLFPQSTKYSGNWTVDNYGPVTIPKKGMTIAINDSTLAFYGLTIKNFDHNKNVEVSDHTLRIDGQEVKEYTFNQNYFFMMGDNRHNSMDSRYWGFVPEDHIVGKAFFIWLSIDKYGDFLHKIRWGRFFNLIR